MPAELTTIYRAYPGELTPETFKQCRPTWFNKINCWNRLLNEVGHASKLHVVWDGRVDNVLYEEISKQSAWIKIHHIDEKDNQKSLEFCYKLAETLDTEYLAFMEDDWIVLPGFYNVLMEGLEKFPSHFVFPYDSPHRYDPAYNDITWGQDYVLTTKNSWWKTSESLMCSVAMSKKLFDKVKHLLYKHCREGIGGPNDRMFFRECLNYGIRTWTSIPTKCTHVVNSDLSPFVDWENV